MSDIALVWRTRDADMGIENNDLAIDDGLETAVILSLFCDRRALDGDIPPDGSDDLRGWWGDATLDDVGDRYGSRIWLVAREKQQEPVLERIRQYALEALQWLIDDRVAERVEVEAEFIARGIAGIRVTVARPAAGEVEYRYNFTWQSQALRAA